MRGVASLAFVLAVATSGCASQRETGAAMVMAGAATTIVGASSASHSFCSGAFGCYYRSPAPWGTKAAVAGAVVAAAGYAVMAAATPRGDAQTSSSPPPSTLTGDAWRLRRKDPLPEPSPPPIEEENAR